MTWRELFTKILWLVGLVAYPLLLLRGFDVSLGKSLLGGIALAFVTPIVFVVLMDLVDQLRAPAKQPQPHPSPPPPASSADRPS
ncbi:MAG TPA: hypothetical protein VGK67_15815 [Myxococcales bacterium]